MLGRRIVYLTTLAGCLVFYFAYQEWFSWFLLIGILALPWLSLVLSLPAMLTTWLRIQCPVSVTVGEEAQATLASGAKLPEPLCRSKMLTLHAITGRQQRLKFGGRLPTEHCGRLTMTPVKTRVYDYLGLFWLPVRVKSGCSLLVRPKPLAMATPPDLSRYRERAWKVKPGGGYAENHELRLYRPGDDLRQVHWKLSAKTGKLILREAMEPVRGLAMLTMELRGTPEDVDRKLGRLLWLSHYLLEQEVPHRICCLTGRGLEAFPVNTPEDVEQSIDSLLAAPAAREDETPVYGYAAWRYSIGGAGDAP